MAAQRGVVRGPTVHSPRLQGQSRPPAYRESAQPWRQVGPAPATQPRAAEGAAWPRGGFVRLLISISPDKHAAGAATSLHSKCPGCRPAWGPRMR